MVLPSNMTVRDAKLELNKLGMVLTKTKYNEFRVNFKGGSEATAYYTKDLDDAVGTGRLMGQQRQVQGSRATEGISERGRLTSSRKVVADLRDDVAKAAKEHLDEAKAQGRGDDESFILERLKESWPYLVVSYLAKILRDVMTGKILDENRGTEFAASRNRMAQAGPTAPEQRNSKWASSEVIDRVATQLETLGKAIPREASNLRGMSLRLDRVANTLEAEQEVIDRISKIENELDGLGVDFTVAPNSSGKQATYIYAYKGQLGSHDEASVLGRIAKKHGSTLENGNRAYKITVLHHVGV